MADALGEAAVASPGLVCLKIWYAFLVDKLWYYLKKSEINGCENEALFDWQFVGDKNVCPKSISE